MNFKLKLYMVKRVQKHLVTPKNTKKIQNSYHNHNGDINIQNKASPANERSLELYSGKKLHNI